MNAGCEGGPVKGVFEKSVVERTKDEKPRQRAGARGVHSQVMRDARTGRRETDEEAVGAVETRRRGEPKGNGLTRNVGLDGVTNRSVAADGSNLQRPIETHGRPSGDGPEAIVGLGQGVKERAENGGRHGKLSVMDVVDAHDVDERNLTSGISGERSESAACRG